MIRREPCLGRHWLYNLPDSHHRTLQLQSQCTSPAMMLMIISNDFFISILSCNDTVVMPLKEYCRSCDQLSTLLPVFVFFQNRQKAKKIFWPDRRRALSRWLLRSPQPPSGITKSLILPKCHHLITQLQNTYFNPRVNSTFLLNFSIIRHCKTDTSEEGEAKPTKRRRRRRPMAENPPLVLKM